MRFNEVIGQNEVKQQLFRMIAEGRVPHALLFAGPEGVGKLAMALALAQRMLCHEAGTGGDSCGGCSNCHMVASFSHPDLHFVFPVFKPAGQNTPVVSDQFITDWRRQLQETPYFTRQSWLKRIGVENQQSLINVAEANNILSKLEKVSSQDGHRILIIWQADQMNMEASNKLLKILEEPPAKTIFILTSSHPELLLQTILSRVQRIDFPPIAPADIAAALERYAGLQPIDAEAKARISEGSFIKALEQVTVNEETAQFFDRFVLLMRLCYMRKIKELYEWSQEMAGWGRERQKAFLDYAQRLIRENFIYNFRQPELNYMTPTEANFAKGFARFVNERNVIGISEEIELAQRDIAQNVNPRMVFFDFSLKMIVLLIQ